MVAGKSRGGVTESGGEKGELRASKERWESSLPRSGPCRRAMGVRGPRGRAGTATAAVRRWQPGGVGMGGVPSAGAQERCPAQ